jgi:hypothetical protein
MGCYPTAIPRSFIKPRNCVIFGIISRDGALFPYLSRVQAGDRATEFGQRRRQLGITGVTLHSYR